MDKCTLLCSAFSPPALERQPTPVSALCAMTGRQITEGYRVDSLVTEATSQPHEIFRYPSEWCSVEAARLFKSMRGPASMLSNLFANAERGVKPLVSKESAVAQDRPCWRDILESLPLGIFTVAVFTEESKRRFWLDAPLTLTGQAWRPYLHWRNVSRVLTVDVERLKALLSQVENVYSLGFSKDAILRGLFDNYQQVQRFGFSATQRLESELLPYRDSDELLLAAFVAQKLPDVVEQQTQLQSKNKPHAAKDTQPCKTSSETPQPQPQPQEAQGQLALF